MMINGTQGEIRVSSPISEELASEATTNSDKKEEICPGGTIVCELGGEELGTDIKFAVKPNLEEINQKLVS